MYELQINGGAYMTTESNRDVVSEVTEEAGKIPSNMFDGDFTTTYKPSAEKWFFHIPCQRTEPENNPYNPKRKGFQRNCKGCAL